MRLLYLALVVTCLHSARSNENWTAVSVPLPRGWQVVAGQYVHEATGKRTRPGIHPIFSSKRVDPAFTRSDGFKVHFLERANSSKEPSKFWRGAWNTIAFFLHSIYSRIIKSAPTPSTFNKRVYFCFAKLQRKSKPSTM